MAAGDEILRMKKGVEEANRTPIERTRCPNDSWPLEEKPDGTLHCPFCGWIDALQVEVDD